MLCKHLQHFFSPITVEKTFNSLYAHLHLSFPTFIHLNTKRQTQTSPFFCCPLFISRELFNYIFEYKCNKKQNFHKQLQPLEIYHCRENGAKSALKQQKHLLQMRKKSTTMRGEKKRKKLTHNWLRPKFKVNFIFPSLVFIFHFYFSLFLSHERQKFSHEANNKNRV